MNILLLRFAAGGILILIDEKSYAALEDLLKRLSLKVYISTRFFRFTELSMGIWTMQAYEILPFGASKTYSKV